jgi:hypothetical protein
MAKAEDLGFQVGSRKGVQIKVAEGRNDLPQIFDAYKASKSQEGLDLPQVICSTPSCVLVEEGKVVKSSWTASHYSARRFETISEATSNTEFDLVPLSKLVDFSGEKRRRKQWEPGITFLSVLHILGDGFVDVAAALTYTPKTPGIPIEPGEILLSRINPRIPRVCVAPDLGTPAICSTEFVVLKCMSPANPYELAYLLQTSIVQNQIQSLTSGTSASHNRIRTSELGEVLIPVARRGSDLARAAERVFSEYEASSKALIQHAMNLAKLRIGDSAMFGSAHR